MATRSVQLPTGSAKITSGRSCSSKVPDARDQFVEAAAEASPGHFFHGKSLGPQTGGIDQILGLIVRDQTDTLTAGLVSTGQPSHRRRLARA